MYSWKEAILISTASLCAVGCVALIVLYVRFSKLREFLGHLSMALAVSGLGSAVNIFLGFSRSDIMPCTVQGVVFAYFSNVSITAITYISIFTLRAFNHGVSSKVNHSVIALVCCGPLVLGILPFTLDEYKLDGEYSILCWIHSQGSSLTTLALQFMCYYIPLILAVVINGTVYYLVSEKVGQPADMSSTMVTDRSVLLIRQNIAQMMWFPFILTISSSLLVILKALEWAGLWRDWMFCLVVFSEIQTFLFCLVYVLLPGVQQCWKATIAPGKSLSNAAAKRTESGERQDVFVYLTVTPTLHDLTLPLYIDDNTASSPISLHVGQTSRALLYAQDSFCSDMHAEQTTVFNRISFSSSSSSDDPHSTSIRDVMSESLDDIDSFRNTSNNSLKSHREFKYVSENFENLSR
mmetsp:Transcript_3877/g.6060  ORF Transcript_3877/g.6060 Transcript_3877/m.6060 type:complete len:408 (-) Transcript_3877:253-1476(-)